MSYKPFVIKTDSITLCHQPKIKPCTGIIARWTEYLAGFDFKVQHIPGTKNVVADAISRTPAHLDNPTRDEEEEARDYAIHKIALAPRTQGPQNSLNLTKFSGSRLKKSQQEDIILGQVINWLKGSEEPTEPRDMRGRHHNLQYYRQILPTMSMVTTPDGHQVAAQSYTDWTGTVKIRLAVPLSLRQEAFEACHNCEGAGHWSARATLARVRNYFIYPGMANDIVARCLNCLPCLQKQKATQLTEGQHKPDHTAGPLQKVYIDLYGPLPGVSRYNSLQISPGKREETPKREEMKYILTVEDDWSRFIDLIPIPAKDAGTVASALLDEFISRFGFPGELYSDQGKEFANKVCAALSELGRYHHDFSNPYNPQANRAERFHRSLGSLMTANLDRTDVNWVSKLQAIKLAYNSKVNRSTGVTPALAFLGHEVKIPISLMIPAPEDQPSQYKWLSQLQETYTKIFNRMYATQAQTHRANAKLYSNKKAPFAVGAVVWYFAKRQVADKPPKLTQKWTGLYRVTQVFNEICLELTAIADPRNIIRTTIHYVTLYRGYNTLHHAIDRPDQLVLPCPDAE